MRCTREDVRMLDERSVFLSFCRDKIREVDAAVENLNPNSDAERGR